MHDGNIRGTLLARINRSLPEIYLVIALPITVLLCLLTAPFFAPDEPNQVCRALSIAAGQLVLPKVPGEAGAQIDSNVFRVMDGVNDIRIDWESTTRDYHNRPYGPVPEEQQRALSGIRWAHRTVFVPFGNTAVYPPALYLPAITGLRIAEAADLTIFQSLRLARLFCAFTAVALGWLALRLCACSRWPLLALLLLPSTLFLNAGCTQDAILVPVAVLIAAMLTRPLVQRRDFTGLELAILTLLLAMCATARPPYVALGLVLFLPAAEHLGRGLRRWLAPTAAFAAVLALCGLWRHLVAPLGLDWSDIADPERQQAFIAAHPLTTAWALTQGTAIAAWDFLHRGLYVVGWNDLLPHHGAAAILTVCLAAILLSAPACPIRSGPARLLLAAAVAGPILGIALAEYIIWTPPGVHTVYGIQPRYWLPIMPLAAMLLAGHLPVPKTAQKTAKAWLLVSATTLLALIACTLPWMVSAAFYRDSVVHVLQLNWR
jgi:uncharacterized membrane protein